MGNHEPLCFLLGWGLIPHSRDFGKIGWDMHLGLKPEENWSVAVFHLEQTERGSGTDPETASRKEGQSMARS